MKPELHILYETSTYSASIKVNTDSHQIQRKQWKKLHILLIIYDTANSSWHTKKEYTEAVKPPP